MRKRLVRGGLVLVFVLALVDGAIGEHGLTENLGLRRRNAAMQARIAELRQSNEALIAEIKRLREDPAAIEELARAEFELMKEGELLIILRDAPESAPASRTSAPRQTAGR